MIHPIPSGTRDVLPDETRELRRITDALRAVFERHGYGEVVTPALEYESELARGDMRDARPAYRVFDENGAVLVLRSDMTVPIARVVATRYPHAEVPLRFCYFAHSYRGVRPQRGQQREMLQAGIELVGSPSPPGTVEALTVLVDALDATGLAGYRIGVGDASLYPALRRPRCPPGEPARNCCTRSSAAISWRSRRRSPTSGSRTTRRSCSSPCPACAAARRCWTASASRPRRARGPAQRRRAGVLGRRATAHL